MKRHILAICLTLLTCIGVNAQDNYVRGIMAIQNNEPALARFYLEKAVVDDPNLGYAHALLAHTYNQFGLNNEALASADKALSVIMPFDNDGKYLALNSKALALANLSEAGSLDEAQKTKLRNEAIENFTLALKIKTDPQSLFFRARLLMKVKRYDEALQECEKINALTKDNEKNYVLMGEIYADMKNHKQAIDAYSTALKINSKNTEALIYRSYEYLHESNHEAMINDMLDAFIYGAREKVLRDLTYLQGQERIAKALYEGLDKRIKNEPNEYVWNRLAAVLNKQRSNFVDAIRYYRYDIDKPSRAVSSTLMADCYMFMGACKEAVETIDTIKSLTPFNHELLHLKLRAYGGVGDYDKAILNASRLIEVAPELDYGYYVRGLFFRNTNELEKAVDDFSMAIDIAPKASYNYLCRGTIYLSQGKRDLANADFNRVIELDNNNPNSNSVIFAYFYLGNSEEAIKRCEKLLAINDDKGNNYDAACLYSLLNNKEKALDYFEEAMEKGYRDFEHLAKDKDLNNIRNERRFIKIVDKYKSLLNKELKATMEEII